MRRLNRKALLRGQLADQASKSLPGDRREDRASARAFGVEEAAHGMVRGRQCQYEPGDQLGVSTERGH